MEFVMGRPEDLGLSPRTIGRFLDSCEKDLHSLYSFAVVKGTSLAALGYYRPMEADMMKMWHSVSKSINSLAVGIAIGDGKLHLDDRLVDLFPEELPETYDERLGRVKIRNMLTMASNSAFTSATFVNVPYSWRRRYFELTPYAEPGEWFSYDTGASYMLSCTVKKVMGKTSLEVLQERVFPYIGVDRSDWLQDKDGNSVGGWGFYTTFMNMVKIARLILNYGNWEGRQLIPEWYMREATKKQIETYRNPGPDGWPYGYGYQFWRFPENCFGCYGAFGQLIVCNAEKDLYVVTTSGCDYTWENQRLARIITETIMAESNNEPLPHEDEEYEKLQKRISALTLPAAEGEVSSEKENEIFGKRVQFPENASGLDEICVSRESEDTVSLDMVFRGKKVNVKAGYQKWITAYDEPLDTPQHIIHSFSYGWISADTLQIKQYMCNTSYYKLYTLKFSGNACDLHMEKNGSLYAEQPVEVKGIIA